MFGLAKFVQLIPRSCNPLLSFLPLQRLTCAPGANDGTGDTTGMAGIGNVPATIASRAANFPPLQGLGVDVGDDTPDNDDPVDYGCDVFSFS